MELEWRDRPALFGQIVSVAERQVHNVIATRPQQSHPALGICQRNSQFVDSPLAGLIGDRHERTIIPAEARGCFERQVEGLKGKVPGGFPQSVLQALAFAAGATTSGNADVQQFNGPQGDGRRRARTKPLLPLGDARPILIGRIDGKEDGTQVRKDVVPQRLGMERLGK